MKKELAIMDLLHKVSLEQAELDQSGPQPRQKPEKLPKKLLKNSQNQNTEQRKPLTLTEG